jgi:hypothetical protein
VSLLFACTGPKHRNDCSVRFFLNAQRSVLVHNVHAVLHLDMRVALDLFVTAALLSFTTNYT